jgi:hypothetical protein
MRMPLIGAQGAARTAQDAARTAQDAARTAQDAARTAQDAARTAQDAARTAQDAARTAQDAARAPRMGAATRRRQPLNPGGLAPATTARRAPNRRSRTFVLIEGKCTRNRDRITCVRP